MNTILLLLSVFSFAVKAPTEVPPQGIDADFYINLKSATTPQHWTFEYEDGGQWIKCGTGIDVKHYAQDEVATFVQSFTVKHPSDSIRVRMTSDEGSDAKLCTGTWGNPQVVPYSGIPVVDTKDIAFIGNSFTFYYASYFLLKQIARVQGHQIRMKCSLRGGYTLGKHLGTERFPTVENGGPYDVVLFQDQSQNAAYYASDKRHASVQGEAQQIAQRMRAGSPKASIIYECTWAYEDSKASFGGFKSFRNFDKQLRKGSKAVVRKSADINLLSPIGQAFELARKEGINVYGPDKKHQNLEGSYLKACVNYLLIYGGNFDESVSLDCGLDHATALSLRQIAGKVVKR
ncbi:MAG: hypothetical protein Q4E55_00930 [Bacteroidales bacterium]|nr:hypothetical protein [Bacteroidales bacterium]